jgi:DHA3 family macrolide efflux protein-like MFS transporter
LNIVLAALMVLQYFFSMNKTSLARWKRDAAIFLSSQVFSLLGSSLVQYAIIWFITLETRSGSMMSLSILFGFLPSFFLSPFAGVWADRHDRKKIIMLADASIAIATLAIAFIFISGRREIWLLLIAMAVRAAGQAIHGPAVGAFLPQFVPKDKLMRVSGINGSLQSAIMIVSPILSGALYSLVPIEIIFFIDAGTAAIAIAVLLFFLKVPPHARSLAREKVSYFKDLAAGFRYVRGHRYLVRFFLYLGGFHILVTPGAFLTPLQTTRSFGPEVWRLTGIEIAFSSGMLAGGAMLAAWGGFRNRMRSLVASTIVMAMCTIALGIVPWFWLYLACMSLFGFAIPFFNTPSAVMLQEKVENEYLGRVYSILSMLSTSLMPLSMLAFGPLADLVKIEWLLLGTGAFMIPLALLGILPSGDSAKARQA